MNRQFSVIPKSYFNEIVSILFNKCKCAQNVPIDVLSAYLFENNNIKTTGNSQAFASACTSDGPRPLPLDGRRSAAYPIAALGDSLQSATMAVQRMTQAPVALCAQSILASTNLAVQGEADVELPFETTRPISNYFITIARSGERKSTVDGLVQQSVTHFENELIRRWKRTERPLSRGELLIELMFIQPLRLMKEAEEDSEFKDSAFGSDSSDDQEAKAKRYYNDRSLPSLRCTDPTWAGLRKFLSNSKRAVGLFSSEGGLFIGGKGLKSGNRLEMAAGLSLLWDGAPIHCVRGTSGHFFITGKRVSAHWMVQPGVAQQFISDPVLLDQGLLSRVLVVFPESTIGTRTRYSATFDDSAELLAYNLAVSEILSRIFPVTIKRKTRQYQRRLPLSSGAKEIWFDYSEEFERALGPGRELEPIVDVANKYPEHAARLAAVLTLFENINSTEIPVAKMEAGIELARFYCSERVRLHEGEKPQRGAVNGQKLITWLHQSWGEEMISLPDVYQNGPYGLRKKEIATETVKFLEEYGWLEKVPGGGIVGGKKRREVWRIVRA